ncbi:MAG: hypothetical protein A2735_03160 [Candidatus Yanofskybacteria bacterium RIFCSPHIGHO2_01_FULL_41_21]|uniref:DUF4870 domain-containing protein n=1 Tax=Candidatus Yanofskybacteria bacterium RIFCSPHIGHO2_01_FULL_41_21 TaxID=1802660 RepID=A0A1F8E981_9BACT|nr:MAG: hypothetical protein A2735_03160 [Candidatus Yanofskybacteria bacterium RIFCSPHIGHO2_01_FULL_41_21]
MADQNSSGLDNNTVMGILSYLGILVIIPFLMAKNVPFVKFHIKQGVVLAVIEIVLWVVSGMLWQLFAIVGILELALLILSIIGIINVVQKKEKELPVVGQFSKYVNF